MPKIVVEEERRRELCQAAREVIAERGVDGATVRAIAERAGVSTGIVAYYLGRKESLILATLADAWDRYEERYQAAAASAEDPRGQLSRLIRESLPLDETGRRRWRFWMDYWAHAARDSSLRKLNAQRRQRQYEAVRSLLQRGTDDEIFRPDINVGYEAHLLLALINGVGTTAMLYQEEIPAGELVSAVEEHLNSLCIR